MELSYMNLKRFKEILVILSRLPRSPITLLYMEVAGDPHHLHLYHLHPHLCYLCRIGVSYLYQHPSSDMT